MICPNCHSNNTDGTKFCTQCGCPLTNAESAVNEGSRPVRFISALLHALLYVAVFLGSQIFVTFTYMMSLMLGSAAGGTAVDETMVAELAGRVLERVVEITLLSNLLAVLVIFLSFTFRRKNPFAETGFRRIGLSRLIPLMLLGFSLNVVVSVTIGLLPIPADIMDAFENQYASLSDGSAGFFMTLLSISVVTGFTEEIVFRGLVNSRLSRGMGSTAVIIISSLIFGVVHGTPVAIVYAALIGVLFSLMYKRFNSILPSMICHITFNATSLILQLFPDNVMLILYVVSICLTAYCVYSIFFRHRDFTDYALDIGSDSLPRDPEERRVIEQLHELYSKNELDPDEMMRLSDEWDEIQQRRMAERADKKQLRKEQRNRKNK